MKFYLYAIYDKYVKMTVVIKAYQNDDEAIEEFEAIKTKLTTDELKKTDNLKLYRIGLLNSRECKIENNEKEEITYNGYKYEDIENRIIED